LVSLAINLFKKIKFQNPNFKENSNFKLKNIEIYTFGFALKFEL